MTDFVTSNTHQSVPAAGQQVVAMAPQSAAAVTTTVSPRIGAASKAIIVTISNITAVGVAAGGTVSVWGSNDPLIASTPTTTAAFWSLITAVVASATTVASQTFTHTADTISWNWYRVTTGVNASTNTQTVVVSF